MTALIVFLASAGFLAIGLFIGVLRARRHAHQAYFVGRHAWWRWRWSQDGWVRRCKICAAWQYGGDDYDSAPDETGPIV